MTWPTGRAEPAGGTDRTESAEYQIRVAGHLDDSWSAWFGGLALTRQSGRTTCLSGLFPDQAALHGLLARVRDLGLVLISVELRNPAVEEPTDPLSKANADSPPTAEGTGREQARNPPQE